MDNSFESTWGVVELMGHNQIAGLLSEQTIAGAAFLRVDVPDADGHKGFTKWFGSAAIYSITPVNEETAKRAAANIHVRPVSEWIVPALESQNRSSDDYSEEPELYDTEDGKLPF